MPSPITSTDFDNQSFSGKLCDLFRQKILNNDKLSDFLGWFLDSSGYPSASFITDIIGIAQPIGSLVLAPMDIGLDSEEYVVCSGQAISRTTYARLFNLIGTSFGSGDGSTTFNVPDLRDRFLVGYSGTKPITTTGGSETVTLTEDEIPSHTHTFSATYSSAGSDDGTGAVDSGGSASTVDSAIAPLLLDPTIGSTGGGAAHDNIPPYVAVAMYIKANFRYRGVTL